MMMRVVMMTMVMATMVMIVMAMIVMMVMVMVNDDAIDDKGNICVVRIRTWSHSLDSNAHSTIY